MIKEQLMHAVPASIDMIRFGVGWGALTRSRGKRGDARGAYLQAKLSGPPVFIRIDDRILPPGWTPAGPYGYRRVNNSMYGLQRGSCDWGRKAHRVIVDDVKGTYIGDHGEGSLYAYVDPTGAKEATLIIVYADDFDVVGPEEDRCLLYTSPSPRD